MKTALAILLLGLTGCGTFYDLHGQAPLDGPAPHVYGGVRNALYFAKQTGCAGMPALVFIPDLPFSAVLDTAILPITGAWAILRGTP